MPGTGTNPSRHCKLLAAVALVGAAPPPLDRPLCMWPALVCKETASAEINTRGANHSCNNYLSRWRHTPACWWWELLLILGSLGLTGNSCSWVQHRRMQTTHHSWYLDCTNTLQTIVMIIIIIYRPKNSPNLQLYRHHLCLYWCFVNTPQNSTSWYWLVMGCCGHWWWWW